jgi:hypothetical protein
MKYVGSPHRSDLKYAKLKAVMGKLFTETVGNGNGNVVHLQGADPPSPSSSRREGR